MPENELMQLELLADVDALVDGLRSWAERAPAWGPARGCQAVVRRLAERADALRVRLEAPLVVATLGGTGTGKSTLVNALVGAEVSASGRQRPTTMRPTLICRPDLRPEMLGIDPRTVEVEHGDAPILRDLVLLDCPDPDTTEDSQAPATNLARLRELLPHCDVLLVTTTQQKYRSARVAEELTASAPGARLVFVQTHADCAEDIRDDWRTLLANGYATGEMFFVDSTAALADSRAGIQPRGEFGRLVDLLTRELSGVAAHRIRRANFLDLVDETLSHCRERLDETMPKVAALETAIQEQRARLAARLADQMRSELLTNRRQWESRLLGEVTQRWGFSPFSGVLRLAQGLGGLVTRAALLRARTPAQMALWGAYEGWRWQRRRSEEKTADAGASRAVEFSWDDGELRTAAIIVDGYAAEAGVTRHDTQGAELSRQASRAGAAFIARAAGDVQTVLGKLASRHTGRLTRWRFEVLLLVVVGLLLYRWGKNFFYDSWWAYDLGMIAQPAPMYGTEFFLSAAFWLLLWCGLLVWMFTGRLRRGLNREIDALTEGWRTPMLGDELFARSDHQARAIHHFRQSLDRLEQETLHLKRRLERPSERIGARRDTSRT
jgi:energy-coupling factor transporter ATP-binding protein EcfA2